MQLGDFQIEFASRKPELIQAPSPWKPGTIPAAEMVALQIEEEKVSTELDELRLREEQLENLLISDPLAYEEMIRNGELEDKDEPATDE